MLKKMPVGLLRFGMQVVDPGLSGQSYPSVFVGDMLISSTQQILELIRAGYSDVYVDTSRGHYFETSSNNDFTDSVRQGSDLMVLSPDVSVLDKVLGDNLSDVKFYGETLERVKSITEFIDKKEIIPLDEATCLVEEIVKNVSSNFDSLLLVSKIKQYDSYTYTHGLNVSIFSVAFGIYLGLSKSIVSGLALSGLFHDVGKSFIPLEILNKPGKLTAAEFEIMKLHPAYGAKIISNSTDLLPEVCSVCLEHHEKFSGDGYPNKYGHNKISKSAAFISILDVFDALTSVRPYKNAMPKHKAVSIVSSLKGIDFLPSLADKFLKFIGVYPVGSVVYLRSGCRAIVVRQNSVDSLRPTVRIFQDYDGNSCNIRDVDLSLAVYSQDPLYDIVGCSDENF